MNSFPFVSVSSPRGAAAAVLACLGLAQFVVGCTAGQVIGQRDDAGPRSADGGVSSGNPLDEVSPDDDDATGIPVTPPPRVSDAGTPPAGGRARVFVTSQSFNGNLGGQAGADTKCTLAAHGANLGGTWKAYLEGVVLADVGPWYNMNDAKVFNNASGVQGGTPLAPLYYDENKTYQPGDLVWTGASTGVRAGCDKWTSGTYDNFGNYSSGQATADWFRSTSQQHCDQLAHLYCFQQ